jgi:protein tyrosine phosphatase
MQWFGWQDFGVPSKSSYDIVKELCDVMIRTVADGKGIVIHCSAGIGRTGTILAIVDAMRIINAGDFADLSIFKLVYNLRMHRYGSVQTVKQYQFIYAFLREYIKRGINPVKQ